MLIEGHRVEFMRRETGASYFICFTYAFLDYPETGETLQNIIVNGAIVVVTRFYLAKYVR